MILDIDQRAEKQRTIAQRQVPRARQAPDRNADKATRNKSQDTAWQLMMRNLVDKVYPRDLTTM